MPVLFSLAALLLMQLLGDAIVRLLGLPLPGALVGLLLLFGALLYRGHMPKALRDTCSHILQHLMLLFIPAVAGIMLHFDRIAQEWLPFLVACIGGTIVTIVVTSVVFHWMLRRSGAHK